MKVLRGGLIGCGYVSAFHVQGWMKQPGAKLVAVCDTDQQRAKRCAETCGARPYFDAEQMFAEQSLDFVEICTRPSSHEPLVELAARHGVPILCQKPIAEDLAAIDRMLATVNRFNVRLMVHENWRFRPWYVRMHEALAAGTVGRALRLRINCFDFRCLAEDGLREQPYFSSMPRLILFEIGPHLVDVARHLFGEPTSVYCVTTHAGPQTGEDSAHLVLRHAAGPVAILDMCWATPSLPTDRPQWGLFESVLEGTSGTLRTLNDARLQLDLPNGSSRILDVPIDSDPRQYSYTATQSHFIECLQTGRPFATDLEDNRRAMQVIFAGYESATTGQAVSIG